MCGMEANVERISFASESAVVERDGPCWSEVAHVDASMVRVRLGGPLRPFWMANLGRGLSEQRLSIQRAHAKRENEGMWVAELWLLPLPSARNPLAVSYLRLANERGPRAASGEKLALTRYKLEESVDHGGTLRLEFEAEDSLGLLGELLASLAVLMLFPVEMHIETRDGRAHDCLWLRGVGASQPRPEAADLLTRLLMQG